jgi:release factor glutamine methyltransferase
MNQNPELDFVLPERLNVRAAVCAVRQALNPAVIENPRHEAEYIIAESMNCSPARLFMDAERILTAVETVTVTDAVRRRLRHEPLQYIFGRAYFMDFWLQVGAGVLIPRPETELLVEAVCKTVPLHGTVCELGTGSGAIALAIGKQRPDVRITAVDISATALEYAEANRQRLQISNVNCRQGDLFAPVSGMRFDYIAANLPYISADEYAVLPVEVRDYEPELALLAADSGTAVINRAIAAAPNFLNPGGRVIFEMGENQGAMIAQRLKEITEFGEVNIVCDYAGKARFAVALMPKVRS